MNTTAPTRTGGPYVWVCGACAATYAVLHPAVECAARKATRDAETYPLTIDPETGDTYYVGDLAAGIAAASQDRHPHVTHDPDAGRWHVEFCDLIDAPHDAGPRCPIAEWGTGPSWAQAWRFALGALMGPLDAEYDAAALRAALASDAA